MHLESYLGTSRGPRYEHICKTWLTFKIHLYKPRRKHRRAVAAVVVAVVAAVAAVTAAAHLSRHHPHNFNSHPQTQTPIPGISQDPRAALKYIKFPKTRGWSLFAPRGRRQQPCSELLYIGDSLHMATLCVCTHTQRTRYMGDPLIM